MPTLTLTFPSSLKQRVLDSNILNELTTALTDLFAKPKSYVQIVLLFSEGMIFGGSSSENVVIRYTSLGAFVPETTVKFSEFMAKYLQTNFGIAPTAYYIHFEELKGHEIGWNSSTFA